MWNHSGSEKFINLLDMSIILPSSKISDVKLPAVALIGTDGMVAD